MKKNIILIYILIILLILFLIIEYFPYGIKKYELNDNTIEIPRMSFKQNEIDNELVLISFRDYKLLKKDINKILNKLEKRNDSYYDVKQEIYIEYKIKKEFIYNKIYIKID